MIITLCRRGLLKIYASFCELNISFCKTLTFRFADYKYSVNLILVNNEYVVSTAKIHYILEDHKKNNKKITLFPQKKSNKPQ